MFFSVLTHLNGRAIVYSKSGRKGLCCRLVFPGTLAIVLRLYLIVSFVFTDTKQELIMANHFIRFVLNVAGFITQIEARNIVGTLCYE